MLLRSRIPRSMSLLVLRPLLLSLESPIASSSDPAHLHGLSDLVLELVLILVVLVDGFLHLAPCADNVFLLVVIVHLIVNFFSVVVEGIIHILLFDLIVILVDALQSKINNYLHSDYYAWHPWWPVCWSVYSA